MQIALIPRIGLGDALLDMVIANNYAIQGHDVTLYHQVTAGLNSWFPNFTLKPLPALLEASEFPEDKILVSCPNTLPDTCFQNPKFLRLPKLASKGTPKIKQLLAYCQKTLNTPTLHQDNGINLLSGCQNRAHENRVIIHPSSANPAKNWHAKGFIQLALLLISAGFEVAFIVSPKESADWQPLLTNTPIQCPIFENLSALAWYIAESGWMIGNDSGIGHLASCLGIPSLSLFSQRGPRAILWQPAWALNHYITPSFEIRFAGLWRYSFSAKTVFNHFQKLRMVWQAC